MFEVVVVDQDVRLLLGVTLAEVLPLSLDVSTHARVLRV